MNPRRPSLALLALLFAGTALTLPAPPADAKPAKTRSARFQASIKGSQILTWSYDRDSPDHCIGSQHAGGSTLFRFRSTQAAPVTAIQAARSNPLYKLSKGRPYLVSPLTASLAATREGTNAVNAGGADCEGNDGPATGPAPIECGTTGAELRIGIQFLKRNRIRVKGDGARWLGPNGSYGPLGDSWGNCPSWITGPYNETEANGDLAFFSEAFAEKRLFDRKQRKIVIHGSDSQCYDDGGPVECGAEGGDIATGKFAGKVVSTYQLTLKRVG